MKTIIKRIVRQFGYDIVSTSPKRQDGQDQNILDAVMGYTMTSQERILATIDSIRYLARNNIPGAIVECGVWRGGNIMAAAFALIQEGDLARELYLFDTFSGMTQPGESDISVDGQSAKEQYRANTDGWCAASLDEVKRNVYSTGYPKENIHFLVGRVEETVNQNSPPQQIALLRLDTDWFESTHHELVHLFPRLVQGGVLIIDDYGYWQGARKAVDEYFSSHNLSYLMHRIDSTGRLLLKCF